jgi:Zn-dependent protease with chaperone function
MEKEYLVLSRQNELEADRQAAECVGSHDAARALALVAAISARVDEVVFTPLRKELLGAITAPAPPLQRIISQLEKLRTPDRIEAAALARLTSEKDDSDATHPSLRRRLANLGYTEIPKLDVPHTSAADSLLSNQAFKDLVARLDNQWSKTVAAAVDIYQ